MITIQTDFLNVYNDQFTKKSNFDENVIRDTMSIIINKLTTLNRRHPYHSIVSVTFIELSAIAAEVCITRQMHFVDTISVSVSPKQYFVFDEPLHTEWMFV